MRWVLCRPRDEYGSLVRCFDGLPRWARKHIGPDGHWRIKDPQPYGSMFRQVMGQQGLSEEQQEQAWQLWKKDNPKYGAG